MEELRGILAAGVLPETLRRVFIGRRSGSLHLAFGIERSDVEFSEGYLTQVETQRPAADKQAVYRQGSGSPGAPSPSRPVLPAAPVPLPARGPARPPKAAVASLERPRVSPPVAVVNPVVSTAPAQPLIDPLRAAEAAAEAFEGGRFHEALAILHEAIPHLAGHARRSARVRKATVLLAVENAARQAEEELKAAIAEDPGNAEAHALLAGIYRERGSMVLAATGYRKALDLQPRHAGARAALAEMANLRDEKPSEPSALKRMFGRKPPKPPKEK